MSTLLYKTHRKPEMTKRLQFRLATTIIILGIITFLLEPKGSLFDPGAFFTNILTGFFILRAVILLLMLWSTRHPFVIYSDHFKFSFLWTMKRQIEDVTSRDVFEKTGQLCLVLEHPRAESTYPITLPWKFILESETEVAAKIDEHILKLSSDA